MRRIEAAKKLIAAVPEFATMARSVLERYDAIRFDHPSPAEFMTACRARWEELAPAVENRLPDLERPWKPGIVFEPFRIRARELLTAPRGTWFLTVSRNDRMAIYQVAMADGFGEMHYRADNWGGLPTYEAMLERMLSNEINLVRYHVADE